MAPPLAPIEASAAQRTASAGQPVQLDATATEKTLPAIRDAQRTSVANDETFRLQAIEHPDAVFSSEVIVANAGPSKRQVFRAGSDGNLSGPCGEAHQPFENARHVRSRKAEIAMPALLIGREEACCFELAKVATRRGRRHAGLMCKLARSERPAIHQRHKHVGPRRIADESGNGCDVRSVVHTLIIDEAWTMAKRLSCSELIAGLTGETT